MFCVRSTGAWNSKLVWSRPKSMTALSIETSTDQVTISTVATAVLCAIMMLKVAVPVAVVPPLPVEPPLPVPEPPLPEVEPPVPVEPPLLVEPPEAPPSPDGLEPLDLQADRESRSETSKH